MKSETNCPFCNTLLYKEDQFFICSNSTCNWDYMEYVPREYFDFTQSRFVPNDSQIILYKNFHTLKFAVYFNKSGFIEIFKLTEISETSILNAEPNSDLFISLNNIFTIPQIKSMSQDQLDQKLSIYLTFQ